jgi:hypothetical protein
MWATLAHLGQLGYANVAQHKSKNCLFNLARIALLSRETVGGELASKRSARHPQNPGRCRSVAFGSGQCVPDRALLPLLEPLLKREIGFVLLSFRGTQGDEKSRFWDYSPEKCRGGACPRPKNTAITKCYRRWHKSRYRFWTLPKPLFLFGNRLRIVFQRLRIVLHRLRIVSKSLLVVANR